MKQVILALHEFLARADIPSDDVKLIVEFPGRRDHRARAEMTYRRDVDLSQALRQDWSAPHEHELGGIKFEFKA